MDVALAPVHRPGRKIHGRDGARRGEAPGASGLDGGVSGLGDERRKPADLEVHPHVDEQVGVSQFHCQ